MKFGSFPAHHTLKVDLGDHPPLVMQGDQHVLKDKRQVSLRWLSGTVLTGLTSIILMGGALMTAIDGQYSVSAATGVQAIETTAQKSGSKGGKGDRITQTATEYSNKQIIDVNVVTREGDREYIRMKAYAFITSTLATRKDPKLSQEIPPYNPLTLFSENHSDTLGSEVASIFADSSYGVKVEGEISIALTRFPANNPDISNGIEPKEQDVERVVRESARFLTAANQSFDVATKAIVDPARFDFNLARQPDLARYAVRITPENVSFVSKTDEETRYAGMEEKIVPITDEIEIVDALHEHSITPDDAVQIQSAFSQNYKLDMLSNGHRLRIAYAPAFDGTSRMLPERVSLYVDTEHKATVARSDTGTYVKAKAPATFLASAFAEADRVSYGGPTPVIYDSLYQTALEQELPDHIIDELIRIFSFDVDYNARVQPGDSLELFFAENTDEAAAPQEVLYAALTTGATSRRFYRFRTPDDGIVDYYDSNGQSAKKFLMRKPLSSGRFRSGFGMRRHPILKYRRMHTGVDWSASRGTPIMAAGNGEIIKAGWSSGYGRRIEIQHTNGYVTTYSHMNGFSRGIRKGARVNQGQIIGSVGSTGLSTGPHLHYEVKVNGNFVDPMRIRLPRGRVLDGDMLAEFVKERDRIDALLEDGKRPSRFASVN